MVVAFYTQNYLTDATYTLIRTYIEAYSGGVVSALIDLICTNIISRDEQLG